MAACYVNDVNDTTSTTPHVLNGPSSQRQISGVTATGISFQMTACKLCKSQYNSGFGR